MGGRPGTIPGQLEIQWHIGVTLAQGSVGLMVVQELFLDCWRYNGIQGYSDTGACRTGGCPGTIPGLSEIVII